MDVAILILVTIVQLFQFVEGDTLHQTMVTPVPYGAGLPGVSFSCIRSKPDTAQGYSFNRPFTLAIPGSTIGNTTRLPNGAVLNSTVPKLVTWYLPPNVDSTGLFHCRGANQATGLSSIVYSIIHSHQRKFEPADGRVTKTINKGDNVTLAVISATGINNDSSPVWQRVNNGGVLRELDQTLYEIQLAADEVADGDLFAVTERDAPLDDNHFGMIRLIIRDCVEGKWGPPGCEGVCDMCYNGGVCDDETGDCICPPGFMEPNCLTACGRHKFGWYCQYECGANNVIKSCAGSQFGLPDPYGNSCISGYYGRDCDTECPTGTFGAGCAQSCYCQSGTCNGFTGECLGTSGCSSGWSGFNCQIPEKCPVGYYGLDCLGKCRCPNDTECEKVTGNCTCAQDDASCLPPPPLHPTELNIILLAAIGGGTVIVIVVLCVALTVCWCTRKRRTQRRKEQVERCEMPRAATPPQEHDDVQVTGRPVGAYSYAVEPDWRTATALQEHDDVQVTGRPVGAYSYATEPRWRFPMPTGQATRADDDLAEQVYENENINPGGQRSSYINNDAMENLQSYENMEVGQ